jgi:hypothetical protein
MDLLAANRRGDLIIESLNKYVTDLDEVRGVAFCVSQDHVSFMAKLFNEKGISAMALTSQSSDAERKTAKVRLLNGEIKMIFVVDLYNEGVDIPEINTVLFLRPTQSLTVFIQQLGRGLRLSENKDCLTVLDFIGQANTRYNFEEKFNALLSNTTKSLKSEIENGFVNVPKGCYIQLEKKAKESILNNITKSFDRKSGLILKIATFTEDSGLVLNLKNFITYYHLDINRIYQKGNFSRLCVIAGLKNDFDEPLEKTINTAFQRICNLDSRRLISFILEVLPQIENRKFSDAEERMLKLFHYAVYDKTCSECGFTNLSEGLRQIKESAVLYQELMELLKIRLEQIDFVDEPLALDFDCPLDLYCSYTTKQVLAGFDYEQSGNFKEGVKYFPDKKIDVFFITLNKSDKDYSPTTMYQDYSVNDRLFHWQSQSITAESSPTGLRYQHHLENGSKVLIFVREFKKGRNVAAPYTCLGLADYVSHEGSKPMNILWRLHKPIPARFLKKTNKLIVG